MDKQDNDKNRQGLVSAFKNSFLMWLLVPLLVPAGSFVVYMAARLRFGRVPEGEAEPLAFNIDFVNSLLITLVVLFFVFVAAADKLAWLRRCRSQISGSERTDGLCPSIRFAREKGWMMESEMLSIVYFSLPESSKRMSRARMQT